MKRPATVPPHNIEIEQAVLGAVILSPVVLPALIEEGVTGDCFHSLRHAAIWAAVEAMSAEGEPIDALTLAHRLRGRPEASDVDTLAGTVPNVGHVRHYARSLVALAEWRAVMAAGRELVAAADAMDDKRRDRAWSSLLRVSAARSERLGRPRLREAGKQAGAAS